MIAATDMSNLFYLVGAIVAATVVSGLLLLRHRRPKSLEAGIEMFSRELKALEPERRGNGSYAPRDGAGRATAGEQHGDSRSDASRPTARPGGPARGGAARRGGAAPSDGTRGNGGARRGVAGAVTPYAPTPPRGARVIPAETDGRDEAQAPSPNREDETG
jgi:hypothetical protein